MLRTQILYVDDVDGSQADGTVRFGLDGTAYESEMNKKHADQFGQVIRPYIDAARKVAIVPAVCRRRASGSAGPVRRAFVDERLVSREPRSRDTRCQESRAT